MNLKHTLTNQAFLNKSKQYLLDKHTKFISINKLFDDQNCFSGPYIHSFQFHLFHKPFVPVILDQPKFKRANAPISMTARKSNGK